jgi:AraC-like DNA-binding protein
LGLVLRRKQLERAADLLAHSSLSVEDVAAASGFGHRSSFYRRFREAYGVTPTQFREATKCD